jgi:hypothetical protein
LDAITGIADAKADVPASKPATFSRVRRVISVNPLFDEFIFVVAITALGQSSNR